MIDTLAWLSLFASIVLAVRGLVSRSMPLLGAASWVLLGTALLTGLASGYLWTGVLGVSGAAAFAFMVLAPLGCSGGVCVDARGTLMAIAPTASAA
jgi:hypothetical protein